MVFTGAESAFLLTGRPVNGSLTGFEAYVIMTFCKMPNVSSFDCRDGQKADVNSMRKVCRQ